MQTGRQVLGDYVAGINRDSASLYIDNSNYGDEWLYVENRCSGTLIVGYAAANSGMYVSTGITIPALSLACVPIDPQQDVMLTLGEIDLTWQKRGRSQGVNDANLVAMNVQGVLGRTVLWTTMRQGNYFVAPLYPLERCVQLSRQVTLAAAAQRTEGVDENTGFTLALLDVGQVPGTVTRRPPQPDACLMGVQLELLTMGAASLASDIIITPQPGSQNDLNFFGNAAAGALPQGGAVSPIYPTRGWSSWLVTNNGAAQIIYIMQYWIGLPAEQLIT